MHTPRLILPLTAAATTAFAITAAPLAAQESEESKTPVIDTSTIVVTGQGLPETPGTAAYSQRTIDRDAITTAPSGRIEGVLSSVAGFQQFRRSDSRSSNPSAQGATLRALGGNATSRALVLLDGVPVSDPFFGFIPFTSLAPERLGAIRVTRGGGAGPFGAGALAGVIELDSAGPGDLSPFTGGLLANDRGGTEASASLSGDLGAGFGAASVRWDRGPGFFTTPRDQRVPATARAAYDSWSASVRGVAPVNDSVELQARGLIFEERRTLRFDGADSSTRGADASIRLVGKGDWEFDALAYLQARNFSNVVISSTRFVRVLDQRNTPSTGLGGKLELRPPVSAPHVLRLGVDYRQSDGELQEEAFSAFTGNLRERRRAGGKNSDLGFFVEDDWTLGALVLTGGLRLDHTRITGGFFEARDADNVLVSETRSPDRSDWSVSYRAGAAYSASDQIRLRAAAYRGLRLPTLNELYRPFVVFPVVTQANAELENERLKGFEVGADWTPSDTLQFTLTAFDNRVEGAIANVTLEPNLRQRQNLPAIEARGVELGARATAGQFSLDGTLAYTDAEVDGSGASLALDGNRPPQTPRWAGSATLAWKPAKGWQAAATLRHIGTQFESDLETGRLPAATTVGAYFQAPIFDAFSLVLRGENLTGETIVTRNANGAIDLGAPRTVWGGVRYGF